MVKRYVSNLHLRIFTFSIDIFTQDWRLSKPKMHTAGEPDPAPDSSEFNGHAQCEHGSLALNTTSRRRISVAVGQA